MAVAEVPPDTGAIVSLEWDFDGAGAFATVERVEARPRVASERRCSYPVPGTYLPAVRVASQRQRDPATPFARIQNLARVRVVVA